MILNHVLILQQVGSCDINDLARRSSSTSFPPTMILIVGQRKCSSARMKVSAQNADSRDACCNDNASSICILAELGHLPDVVSDLTFVGGAQS